MRHAAGTTLSDSFADSGRKPAADANRVDGAGNRIWGNVLAAGRADRTRLCTESGKTLC